MWFHNVLRCLRHSWLFAESLQTTRAIGGPAARVLQHQGVRAHMVRVGRSPAWPCSPEGWQGESCCPEWAVVLGLVFCACMGAQESWVWFRGVGIAWARFSRVDSRVARSPRVYFQRVCVSRGLNCRIAEPASKRCARSFGCTDRAGVVGGLSFLAATFQQFTFHKVFRCLKTLQKHAQSMFLGCT